MIDWDDAFDNSGYVPEAAAMRDGWAELARDARANLNGELDLPYGAHDREVFDLFRPEGQAKGLAVFVHGGYWRMLDKSYWSHLARGPLSHGWAVAIIQYPLAPDARIGQISQSVAAGISSAATQIGGPIRLIGHSAGGHLVSRMMCSEGPLDPSVTRRLGRVVSVSGVHDLRPLLLTKMNDDLRLDAEEAASESPALIRPNTTIPVTFWVGAKERPEFLRQTRLIAENWEMAGCRVETVYDAEKNHFSVIDSLQDPKGALTQALLAR